MTRQKPRSARGQGQTSPEPFRGVEPSEKPPVLSEEGAEGEAQRVGFIFHLYPYRILRFKPLTDFIKFYQISSISFPMSRGILVPGQQPG